MFCVAAILQDLNRSFHVLKVLIFSLACMDKLSGGAADRESCTRGLGTGKFQYSV